MHVFPLHLSENLFHSGAFHRHTDTARNYGLSVSCSYMYIVMIAYQEVKVKVILLWKCFDPGNTHSNELSSYLEIYVSFQESPFNN